MQRQDFWCKKEAESLGTIPTAAKAGQFLCLSAQTGVNLETGEIIRALRDLPEGVSRELCHPALHCTNAYFGPTMAQTWMIYQNISKILAQHGASLDDVIRQRIFLRNVRDVEWMEKVMLPFFPKERPTTMFLGVADKGLNPDTRVWVEVMALIPKKGGLVKEAIYLPELRKVAGPYPQAVKVGQFLFIEGMMGIDTKSGHPVTSFNELEPEARTDIGGLWSDLAFEATKAQYWLCHQHIRQILESQGANINDILHTYTFRKHGVRMMPETDYIREKIYKAIETSPTSEGFGIIKLCIVPEVEIVTGCVALLPGEYKKEALKCGDTNRVGAYAGLTKAGPFWFSAGMSGVDLQKQTHITNFSEFGDEGRFLAEGRVDDEMTLMAKTWYTYKYMLDEVETKASQVMQQTVYLTNPAEWPAVERVAKMIFKGRVPPTTIIPVDEMVYYWQSHMSVPPSVGAERVEIGLWGLT